MCIRDSRTLERHFRQQQIEHPQRLGTDRLLAFRRLPARHQNHALAPLLIAVGGHPGAQFVQWQALEGFEGLGQLACQQCLTLARCV